MKRCSGPDLPPLTLIPSESEEPRIMGTRSSRGQKPPTKRMQSAPRRIRGRGSGRRRCGPRRFRRPRRCARAGWRGLRRSPHTPSPPPASPACTSQSARAQRSLKSLSDAPCFPCGNTAPKEPVLAPFICSQELSTSLRAVDAPVQMSWAHADIGTGTARHGKHETPGDVPFSKERQGACTLSLSGPP